MKKSVSPSLWIFIYKMVICTISVRIVHSFLGNYVNHLVSSPVGNMIEWKKYGQSNEIRQTLPPPSTSCLICGAMLNNDSHLYHIFLLLNRTVVICNIFVHIKYVQTKKQKNPTLIFAWCMELGYGVRGMGNPGTKTLIRGSHDTKLSRGWQKNCLLVTLIWMKSEGLHGRLLFSISQYYVFYIFLTGCDGGRLKWNQKQTMYRKRFFSFLFKLYVLL